jgi:hypothetical protein
MRAFACASLLALAGCVPPVWVVAQGPYQPPSRRYRVELPAGWMRLDRGNDLLLTRDGPGLQRIFCHAFAYGKPLGATKKVVVREMTPQEAGEVLRDDLASAAGASGARITDNAPAQVAGRPGFRLTVELVDDGLPMQGLIYGVMASDALYALVYVAPRRHYFARDEATFQRVLASFQVYSNP